jgi:hypothetical protein
MLGAFTPREGINACPGWKTSFPWNIDVAEQLDSQRLVPGSKETAFTASVREKIRQVFRAMSQDFDNLLMQAGDA